MDSRSKQCDMENQRDIEMSEHRLTTHHSLGTHKHNAAIMKLLLATLFLQM